MLILASYSLHRAIATGTLARSCPKCLSSIPVISGTFRRATFYHTANSHTNRSHQLGVRRCLSASAVRQMEGVTYLTQEQAIAVDEDLMGPLGFSVDQLMELAGLSVAQAIYTEYPPTTHRRVLIVAGPGNNGGDGLVAARHLHHFGYTAQVLYPKPTDKPLYNGLVTQLRALEVPLVAWSSISESPLAGRYDIVIDAMFGFSFKGQPRAPFAEILAALHPDSNPPPIISVDIPSGWDVEQGDVSGGGLRPEMLVSLTAPKNAAKKFEGRHHYVGGRFVPPAVKAKFDLKLPPYAGSDQVVKLNSAAVGLDPSQMRLVSKDTPLAEGDVNRDPFIQFDLWLKSAVGLVQEPTAMCLATVGPDSQPNARYVLLKEYNEKGFVFYSNNDSTKGEELERVRKAALCFYWEPLERQVRTQGTVIPVSDEDADAYFHSRPRSSQIGAWVSHQSAVIASRSELDDAAKVLEETYSDVTKAVPRPPHWVGYRLIPDNIEFWQGRASRLHDRIIFKRSESGKNCWSMERLSP